MKQCSGRIHVRLFIISVISCCLFVVLPPDAYSYDVTVNSTTATSGTNYNDFDAVLTAIQNGVLIPSADTNTITFTDTAQVTFEASTELSPGTNDGVVVFRGVQTDPDKFPVINRTDGDWYNFLSRNEVIFEGLTFTGSKQFRCGDGATRRRFINCVVRSFESPALSFIVIEGNIASTTIFENCLFANNTFSNAVVELIPWGLFAPVVTIVNCTFHNSGTIFTSNASYQASATSVFNCLFSSNSGGINAGTGDVRPQISYSVTQEDVVANGYGENCIDADPLYQLAVGKMIPSDFILSPTSPAKNAGIASVNTITAPATDISGAVRMDSTGRRDVGCWDIQMPPTITLNLPADTTVELGDRVVLKIAASGSEPLSFSWRQVGAVAAVATTDSLVLPAIEAGDDGARYYCVVKNNTDSVWSDTVQIVVSPVVPQITSQTADTIVTEGSSLTLRVAATGYPAPAYEWTIADSATVLSTADSLSLTALTPTAGTVYRCVVSNTAGSDSAAITVIVNQISEPSFTLVPDNQITLRVGEDQIFSVAATGAIPIQFTWYKNGMAPADSIGTGASYGITGATAADAGTYYCIATNAYGSDTAGPVTITINSATVYNLLEMDAERVNPTSVRISISNFRNLPATAGTEPWVDSIGIWYDYVTFPAAPLSRVSTSCIKISLQQMLAGVSDTFSTDITVPLSEACATPLYLVTAPLWNSPDSIPPEQTSSQRATVVMCSADVLQNLLILDVGFIPSTDSISVTLSNLTSINPDSLLYLLIEYRKGTGSYVSNPSVKINGADLPAGGAPVASGIRDAAFTGIEDSVRVRVRWRSVQGDFSTAVSKAVMVGNPRPKNTVVLSADSSTVDSIYLSWSDTAQITIDSIRIWWSRQVLPTTTDINPATASFVALPATARNMVLTGLLPATRYYIGAQLFSGGIASLIPSNAQDSIITLSPFQTSLPNTIKLTELRFDSSTNSFKVTWDVDVSEIGAITDFQTGILWDIDQMPNTVGVPDNGFAAIVSDLQETENTTTVSPGSRLWFSRTYYFTLLLRRKGEPAWTVATDSSVGMVTTTPPSHQVVSYFMNDETRVTAFNNQVHIVKKEGTGIVNVTDTLRVFHPVDTNGFIVASIGVDFAGDYRSDPVLFGIAYDTARMAGYPPGALRMYQYNASGGVWNQLAFDTIDSVVNHVVYFDGRLSEHPDPFVLMIDTLQPQVELLTSTEEAVLPGVSVQNSLVIFDNVANSSIGLYYWNAYETGRAPAVTQKCDRARDTVIVTITGDSIISDWGVKAKLVINDGRFIREQDVSRSARRTISDPVVLTRETWTPVFTTANLVDSSVAGALRELSPVEPWTYDSTLFQIYRWYTANQVNVSPGGDMDITSKWMRYSGAASSLFSLTPGKVLWVKARYTTSIQSLGPGTTVPLENEYVIPLMAKQWNDVALPFKFDITIGDVVNATGRNGAIWDSLFVYRWSLPDSNSNTSTTVAKYMAAIPGLNDSTAVFSSTSGEDGLGTYSILNVSNSVIELHLPPIPERYSTFTSSPLAKNHASHRGTSTGWSIAVHASVRKAALSPVYLGCTPGEGISCFPVSPTFQKQRVIVRHPENKTVHGHLLYHGESATGYCYRVEFVNNAPETVTFNYSAIAATALPEGFTAGMYNPSGKSVECATDEHAISVAGNSTVGRWIVVGDTSYIAAWQSSVTTSLALLKVFPNPCRGELSVLYTIPEADIRRLRIALFDQLGRRVWSRQLENTSFIAGSNTLRLHPGNDAALGAGTYILRITAIENNGSVFGIRQKRILLIP